MGYRFDGIGRLQQYWVINKGERKPTSIDYQITYYPNGRVSRLESLHPKKQPDFRISYDDEGGISGVREYLHGEPTSSVQRIDD